MNFEGFESDSFKRAKQVREEYGLLGMTFEDHEFLGSTPPKILEDNPGKTLGEIMSDDKILDWLNKNQRFLEDFKDGKIFENSYQEIKQLFFGDIEYLKKIYRLPKDFRQTIF